MFSRLYLQVWIQALVQSPATNCVVERPVSDMISDSRIDSELQTRVRIPNGIWSSDVFPYLPFEGVAVVP